MLLVFSLELTSSLRNDSLSSESRRILESQLNPGLRINSQRPIETAMLILVRDMGFDATQSRVALLESDTNVETALLVSSLAWD